MQQLTCKMVWSYLFILLLKSLNFKESPGGKSVEKCEKSVETILLVAVAL